MFLSGWIFWVVTGCYQSHTIDAPDTLPSERRDKPLDAPAPVPRLSIAAPPAIDEGDFGPTLAAFDVRLEPPATQSVEVRFATRDGSATVAAHDYFPVTEILTFNPGETSKRVTVRILSDFVNEADMETFYGVLSDPLNADVAVSVAQVEIVRCEDIGFDFDADGFGDVLVGAYRDGVVGRAFAFFGSFDAFRSEHVRSPEDADVVFEGGADDAEFGQRVTAGDVDGDGRFDVIVGARTTTVEGAGGVPVVEAGRAYVYLGRREHRGTVDAVEADAIFEGEAEHGWFGETVATVDLNADGIEDLAVGAPRERSGAGMTYVFFGAGSLKGQRRASEADVVIAGIDDGADPNTPIGGLWISATGDLNDDGIEDLAIAAYRQNDPAAVGSGVQDHGAVYVFYGNRTRYADASTPIGADAADLIVYGEPGDNLGPIDGAGDFNADGIDDLLVGAFRASGGIGGAFVFFGGTDLAGVRRASGADWSVVETRMDSYLGYSVAAAGDVNGDGVEDMLIGAREALLSPRHGRGFVFLGDPALGSGPLPVSVDDGWERFIGRDAEQLTFDVGRGVDVDADHLHDLVLGARLPATLPGRAYLVPGSLSRWGFLDSSELPFRIEGASADDRLGMVY